MFEPNASWSLPAHLFLVSLWSAVCPIPNTPLRCVNNVDNPDSPRNYVPPGSTGAPTPPLGPPLFEGTATTSPTTTPPSSYEWTDLSYLLFRQKISWGYFLATGNEPDCENPADVQCAPVAQNTYTPEFGIRYPTLIPCGRTTNLETSNQLSDLSLKLGVEHCQQSPGLFLQPPRANTRRLGSKKGNRMSRTWSTP